MSAFRLPAQDIVLKSSGAPSSLIELYSSEGCSSCPPAEEWVNQLKSAPGLWKDIFPVAFHVDYWDGLGWPDRFARAEFTQRQRDYAARLKQDSVYTPEFIVNGQEWQRSWLGGRTLPVLGVQKSGDLTVTVSAKGKEISAVYTASAEAKSPLVLNVALLGFNVITDVKRGENSGRKLEHDFVVLNFKSAPLTAGANATYHADPVSIPSLTDDVPGAVVVWVSRGDGAIAQIAGGWLH